MNKKFIILQKSSFILFLFKFCIIHYNILIFRGIAQGQERWPWEPEVAGSNPAAPTKKIGS